MPRRGARVDVTRLVTLGFLAAAIGIEVLLCGWWAVTRQTPAFVVLQPAVATLVGIGLLGVRYRRTRLAYERGIVAAAVGAERTRQAEELHDALGHDLGILALRAGALQLHATGATAELAAELRQYADTAVTRLREAVAVLRDGSDRDLPYEPANESIDKLIARASMSGAALDVVGAVPDGLSHAIDRALYQVVREGVTNAARHAAGTPITIVFTTRGDRLGVSIRNAIARGRSPTAPSRLPGTGIPSLRRRVQAIGGELTARVEGRSHELSARLPATTDGPVVDAAAIETVRPALRTPLRSVMAPAVVACVLVVSFFTWATLGSTMEAETFASIHRGDQATVVRQLVPARQATVRLTPTRPHPADWTCTSYTDGNFPLGLAAFEICYHDDRVVRTRDLRREAAR